MNRVLIFLIVLVFPAAGAQLDNTTHLQEITFHSIGSGYGFFQLKDDVYLDGVQVLDREPDAPYGLVFSGPSRFNYLEWKDFRFPAYIPSGSLAYPLKAGTYHIYSTAQENRPLEIKVILRNGGSSPLRVDLLPHSGNMAVHMNGIQEAVPLGTDPNLVADRGKLRTLGPSMLVTMEDGYFEGTGASAYVSWHSVHNDLGQSQCQPGRVSAMISAPNVIYRGGIVTGRAFLVDAGEHHSQILAALPGAAVFQWHRSYAMAVSLATDDPFHDFRPPFWQQVFALHPVLDSLPQKTKDGIVALACTPGYLPLDP